MQRFKDRVVMVTGAGGGIGKAGALRIAEEGGSVFCVDLDAGAVEATVAEIEARYRIHTHPLTKRFVYRDLASGEAKSFSSLAQMLDALGRIDEFPLLDANLLELDARYTARVRAKLDIESLPAPLRPTAYLSPSWHISSDWYEWPIEP